MAAVYIIYSASLDRFYTGSRWFVPIAIGSSTSHPDS